MKIDKFNIDGKKETIEVMDKIFSAKVNKKLVSGVIYKTNANYKGRKAKTKQKNEIIGSTSKIYAFGEGSSWPVQGLLRHFRKEVESRCREEPLIKKKLNNPYLVDQHLLENKNA